MIGRREFMLGAALAGVLIQPRFGYAKHRSRRPRSISMFRRARAIATRISMAIRPVSVVCGAHVYARDGVAGGNDHATQSLKIQRVVIVTPSVYGPDNSATIYGMAARGKDARGVAVIDDKTTDADWIGLRRLASRAYASTFRLPASTIPRSRPSDSLPPLRA